MKEVKKTSRFEVRISDQELEEIKKKADALGFKSISNYLRTTALNHKIIIKTDKDMVRQIRFIGININQIARHLNTYSDEAIILAASIQMDEYKELLQIMLDKMASK